MEKLRVFNQNSNEGEDQKVINNLQEELQEMK